MDLEVVCWEGTHQALINWVSVPAIIIFVIGMPLYFVRVLYLNKELIANISNKENLDTSDQYKMEVFVQRWGFLILGLKPEYWFWEVVVMFRKTIMIFATDTLSSISGEVQVLVCVLICVFNLLIIVRIKPF